MKRTIEELEVDLKDILDYFHENKKYMSVVDLAQTKSIIMSLEEYIEKRKEEEM